MRIGIVGHGSDKFTIESKQKAIDLITHIVEESQHETQENPIIISGHSPVGGIDIWAEDVAQAYNLKTEIKVPLQNMWDAAYGYKQRNLDIARCSDVVHVILVDVLPPKYKGMRFNSCYHCNTNSHIKSGGCWTGLQAKKLGKPVHWHIIKNA
jgi:hypothetical protein